MIDFPASPTDGQIFSATNGVVYKWSATYSSWLAQNSAPPLGGTGDFCATSGISLSGTAATIVFNTIYSGNSTGAYSISTGRYTPPAGRYSLFAEVTSFPTSGSVFQITIRKNGASIVDSVATATANGWVNPVAQMIVDANGSDWFDVQCSSSVATTAGSARFMAFPLTGMQGPTGGAPGPVVGDFCAILGTGPSINATPSTLIPTTIVTGNSGSYYNVANGRWTPPAGRYAVECGYTGANPTGFANYQTALRKNGTQIGTANADGANAAYVQANPRVSVLVDANGTDWFDFQGWGDVASSTSGLFFQAFPTQGMVGPQGPTGPAGVTQTVFFETGAVATGTGIIPSDDTIPQQTEGDQYMSLSITPQSATSKLIIEITMSLQSSTVGIGVIIAALFQDSTANALAAGWITSNTQPVMMLTFKHVMISGTTSTTTFKVRAGAQAAGTTTFNGSNGSRYLGGTLASSIVIREVP